MGVADGIGFTVNLPFRSGFGDDEYVESFKTIIEPIARQFDPDFVLISAGFDHHHLDPLGNMTVTRSGISAMTRVLLAIANECAGGRCAAVLEGGYSLDALKEGVACVLDDMGGEDLSVETPRGSAAEPVIATVRKVQKRFWDV